MQTPRTLFALLSLLSLTACQREGVRPYAPIETFAEETITDTITRKVAMVVTAHDDDMCAMSGTLSKLNQKGWHIVHLCFRNEDEERNAAHIRACHHVLDSVRFIELTGRPYRSDLNSTTVAHDALPVARIDEVYHTELVEGTLFPMINALNPSIIFSLDNEIGGYGHPDHVFISRLVLKMAGEGLIHPDYIFQSVYTDHMEESIVGVRHSARMKSWGFEGDGWEKAKKTYAVSGMPEPNVQVNIRSEAQNKMNYLRSYNERERKTIGFFIPAFEDYEAEEYFEIFDRGFFRVIRTRELRPAPSEVTTDSMNSIP